jgi:HTH-type transcriptional regulator/antitoxin HigA
MLIARQKTGIELMTQVALFDAYQSFMTAAQQFVSIANDADYSAALNAMEQALESADDTPDDRMNPLIDMLSHAIEKYELRDKELMAFVADAEGMPADIALLRTLMSQHKLTGSDLPEIGGKAMVSRVLRGERSLSRSAIEQLAARFELRPAVFFGEVS